MSDKTITIDTGLEDDGRWYAAIADLPGVMAYGETETDALRNVAALVAAVLIEELSIDGVR